MALLLQVLWWLQQTFNMSAADIPEEELRQDPKLEMAQKLFLLRSPDASAEEKLQIQTEVLAAIKQDGEAWLRRTSGASRACACF